MTIFEFDNYKAFVQKRVESMPKRGHGQYRKIAEFLSVNSVNISQIFRGSRDLTAEQALSLCDFFGFSKLEGSYFVTLVERDRAGTHQLKTYFSERLDELREKSTDLKQRLPQQAQLSEEAKAIFYSNWFYSGIRLLSSIPSHQTPDAIAEYFGLSRKKVSRVLEFLVAHGLCKEEKGRFIMGPASTHLEANSPLISRHHTNWRLKAIEGLENISEDELSLTMPCSLSPKALRMIRKELVDVIERASKIIDEAPCEQLAMLNIDLLKF